jgi:hypothetical protein
MKSVAIQVIQTGKWNTSRVIAEHNEEIYGISVSVRSSSKILMYPDYYCTYEISNRERQREKYDNDLNYMDMLLSSEWREYRSEVFVKKGSYILEAGFLFEGIGEVEIGSVTIVKGGFSTQPLQIGPPYMDWINSIKYFEKYEKSVIDSFSSVPNDLEVDCGYYLSQSLKKIYSQVPRKRPFMGELFKNHPYYWMPETPEFIYDKLGNVVQKDLLNVTGIDEAVGCNGSIIKYPYNILDGRKVYIDNITSTTKLISMWSAANQMAREYRKCGNKIAASKAVAIFAGICNGICEWPIFGQEEWNIYEEKFMPPDSYEYWYAWIGSGIWYTAASGRLMERLVYTFSLLNQSEVWEQASKELKVDIKKLVTDAMLYVAKLALKFDAYHRFHPWKYYHNTTAEEIKGFILTGLSIGCPELVHYGVNKAVGVVRYCFMPDGMFPESVSYIRDIFVGLENAMKMINGYNDPKNYISQLDNCAFTNFIFEEHCTEAKLIRKVMERLKYPEGSLVTTHDTWASSLYLTGEWRESPETEYKPDSRVVSPYLIPEFGHMIMGRGIGLDAVEAHFHYSGLYNHGHYDMLNLGLWGYGDELLSDVGYTHIGGYPMSTICHNLVMVNKKSQKKTHVGNMKYWFAEKNGIQYASVSSNEAYTETEQYRRSVVFIPFKNERTAILDIFEVKGGQCHDWICNGSADYGQIVKTSLRNPEKIDVMDQDVSSFQFEEHIDKEKVKMTGYAQLPMDTEDKISRYYGAYYDILRYPMDETCNMTFERDYTADMTGIPTHIRNQKENPGLSVILFSDSPCQISIGNAPRNRYARELEHHAQALETWDKRLMKKVIVRKEGKDLESMFCALWEPYKKEPGVTIEKLREISSLMGAGFKIESGNETVVVIYRKPEYLQPLKIKEFDVITDAKMLIIRIDGGNKTYDLQGGSMLKSADINLELPTLSPLELVEINTENEETFLIVSGDMKNCKLDSIDYVKLCNGKDYVKWYPVKSIDKAGKNQYRITLQYNPRLEYTLKEKLLVETAFPYRKTFGSAYVSVPQWTKVNFMDGKCFVDGTQSTSIC